MEMVHVFGPISTKVVEVVQEQEKHQMDQEAPGGSGGGVRWRNNPYPGGHQVV